MLRLLALLLLLTFPALAQTWSRQDGEWKHSNGMSLTFPQEFLVQSSQEGVLTADGKQGFVRFTVQGLRGEKEQKSWQKANQQSLEAEKLKITGQSQHALESGVRIKFQEAERLSEQGVLFVIVFAECSKGQDHLGIQFYYPRDREKDWTPLFQSILGSVKR